MFTLITFCPSYKEKIMAKYNSNFVYETEDVTTIRELIERSAYLYGDRPAFLIHEDGDIKEITYSEVLERVKAFAAYLRSKLSEGCKIAVTGKNSHNWVISYLAVTCGVGIVVPIDKDLRGEEIGDLIKDAEADAVIYSPEQEEKMALVPDSVMKFNMDGIDGFVSEGKALIENGDTSYRDHKINPHALGSLLYTSGTTGVAKGVMLSQYNICFDLTHALRRVKIYPSDVALSIAPLHHTYETTVGCLLILYSGAALAYNSSLKRLQAELKIFRPTVMAVVPLILETFRNAIFKKYKKIKGGKLIFSLQKAASDMTGNKAGKKIFSIISETFGGRLRLMVCGAALLAPEVFRDYERFGIKLMIGYGLTETAPISLMHNDFYTCPDDIGYPVSGVSVKLDDVNEDGVGELLVKGPNVMLGYYKNPEETAKAMTEDGYFRTGDLARQKPNGAYQIAGRAKSMIVSPGGKKIFPEELELYLEKSEYVKESLVYEECSEDGKRIVAAIIADDENVASKLGMNASDEGYASYEKELFEKIVKDVNSQFPNYKHIGKIYIRKTDFIKTTTRKIKRNAPENLENE